MSIADLKLIILNLTNTPGPPLAGLPDQCSVSLSVSVSPALHVQAVYVTHPHSHSEQTRLRPSLGILCSIYFLGSRDAAYINIEQSFKELRLWKAILYRVNNRGEQVTQHFEPNSHFPVFRMIVSSELYFYLERGGM